MLDRNINDRIPLYAYRTFGETIGTALDFLRNNWPVLLRLLLYLLLPLAMIHSMLAYPVVCDIIYDTETASEFSKTFFVLLLFFAMVYITSIVLVVVRYYEERDGDLTSLTVRQVLNAMFNSVIWRTIAMFAAISVVVFIIMTTTFAITAGSMGAFEIFGIFLFLLSLVLMAVVPLLVFHAPILYVIERCSFWDAIRRTFQHLISSFLSYIGFSIGLFILSFWLLLVATSPIVFFEWISSDFLTPEDSAAIATSTIVDVLLFLYSMLYCLLLYLIILLWSTSVVYFYGGTAAKHDDVLVAADVENFENL